MSPEVERRGNMSTSSCWLRSVYPPEQTEELLGRKDDGGKANVWSVGYVRKF